MVKSLDFESFLKDSFKALKVGRLYQISEIAHVWWGIVAVIAPKIRLTCLHCITIAPTKRLSTLGFRQLVWTKAVIEMGLSLYFHPLLFMASRHGSFGLNLNKCQLEIDHCF